MTVNELIEALQKFPGRLPVVYRCCSEYDTLKVEKIKRMMLQPARPDGWVHDNFSDTSAGKCTVEYVVLPGN